MRCSVRRRTGRASDRSTARCNADAVGRPSVHPVQGASVRRRLTGGPAGPADAASATPPRPPHAPGISLTAPPSGPILSRNTSHIATDGQAEGRALAIGSSSRRQQLCARPCGRADQTPRERRGGRQRDDPRPVRLRSSGRPGRDAADPQGSGRRGEAPLGWLQPDPAHQAPARTTGPCSSTSPASAASMASSRPMTTSSSGHARRIVRSTRPRPSRPATRCSTT